MKLRVKISEFLFISAFVLMQISKYLILLNIKIDLRISTLCWMMAISLFTICLLSQKICISEVLFLLICIISFLSSEQRNILVLGVVLVALKATDIDKIIKIFFFIELFGLSSIIVLYFLFYIIGSPMANLVFIAGRYRHTFLCDHPNGFSAEFVFCILAGIYLNFKKLKYYQINLILLFAILFIWFFPKTQTAVICLIIFGIILFLTKYGKNIGKEITKWIPVVFAIFIIGMVYLTYKGITITLFEQLNSYMSGRLQLGVFALKIYPLKLFGQSTPLIGEYINIDSVTWTQLWIDIGFLMLFISCGIVAGCSVIFLIVKSLFLFSKEKNYLVIALLTTLCFYALSEWGAFSITTAFPLFFLRKGFFYNDR